MTVGAGVLGELAFLRREAESLMTDTFDIYSPTARTTNASGQQVQGSTRVGSTVGKLQLRHGGDPSTSVTVGGVERLQIHEGLHVPLDSPAPVSGWRGAAWEYELTKLGSLTPRELLGSRWLVVDATTKTHMTARRLHVVRVS